MTLKELRENKGAIFNSCIMCMLYSLATEGIKH